MTVLIESEKTRTLLNATEIKVNLEEKNVVVYIFESDYARKFHNCDFRKFVVFDGGQKIYTILGQK
jgi:c-di-GMP-binding flagellar brake protein YcgR